jgi:hypothetical protein
MPLASSDICTDFYWFMVDGVIEESHGWFATTFIRTLFWFSQSYISPFIMVSQDKFTLPIGCQCSTMCYGPLGIVSLGF